MADRTATTTKTRLFMAISSSTAARARISVGVDGFVADGLSIRVQNLKRLLKVTGLWRASRHCRLEDVQPVVVHMRRHERAGTVGVCDLGLKPFDQVLIEPAEERGLR